MTAATWWSIKTDAFSPSALALPSRGSSRFLGTNSLTLRAEGSVDSIELPLEPVAGSVLDVVIWRDTVRAVDFGSAAADWLTRQLRQPARLVAMASDFSRPIAKPSALSGDEAAFADAYPLLVLGESSLADLNHRLDDPLDLDRFRPNLVLRGSEAYAEDTWSRIRIGDVILRAAGPCARCVITTTNQQTLERGKEPLRTLAQYRRRETGEVDFGQNYIHETKSGVLRVGTSVELLD